MNPSTPHAPAEPSLTSPPNPAALAKAPPITAITTADSTTAGICVTAYLIALGVGEASAATLVAALDRRVDPQLADPAKRAAAMLDALAQWEEALPEALGMEDAEDRVGFVVAMHLGRLLHAHPEALDDEASLLTELRGHLDTWPQGVLPVLPKQAMHRQPLGELPRVLRGEFWSGTYRWAMPSKPDTGQALAAAPPPPSASQPPTSTLASTPTSTPTPRPTSDTTAPASATAPPTTPTPTTHD